MKPLIIKASAIFNLIVGRPVISGVVFQGKVAVVESPNIVIRNTTFKGF